jgi:hypothetical protein
MTLLQEIQEGATGNTEPLTVVLRKCMILAARLDHQPFRDWVTRELEGYPEDQRDDVPSYRRKMLLQVHGTLRGPFGSGIDNARIPPAAIDEEWHEALFYIHFIAGVGYLESQIESGDDFLQIPWPSDALVKFGDQIYEGQTLVEAHKVLPATLVKRVLDQVRDRVLAFSLDIEKEAPDAGEAQPGQPPLPEAQVAQVFNTTIIGDRATVAATGRDLTVNNIDEVLPDGKWEELESGLAEIGVPAEELEGLRRALESDGGAAGGELGPAAKTWVGRATEKIAAGLWPVTAEAGGGVVAGLVLRALGLA